MDNNRLNRNKIYKPFGWASYGVHGTSTHPLALIKMYYMLYTHTKLHNYIITKITCKRSCNTLHYITLHNNINNIKEI